MITTDRMLTTRDVANLVGVSPDVVRTWIREHKIPAFIVGVGPKPRYRVRESDLLRFVRPRESRYGP